jgi:O-acetyl-ADP-ribose deacetylase (regulator of RNase III)
MMKLDIGESRILLLQGDITQQSTDAIVNAANSSLMGGGGVDGAIHHAGGPVILEECRKIISRIGRLQTGKAVITSGGDLKAKYVIHTVGPIWHGGDRGERELLESAYTESLKLAIAYKLKSISFPSISTGAYRFPVGEAARIAVNNVVNMLRNVADNLNEVVFVLFDKHTFDVYAEVIEEVRKEIVSTE